MDTSSNPSSSRIYTSGLVSSQIRLLTLQAGQGSDPLICRLHVAELDDKPDYEALSYVWGNAMDTRPIILREHEFNVTINLDSALRHLRLPDANRILWVDALCINQNKVAERNHQVSQMAAIYEDARTVVVWLGEGSEDTDAAMDAIEALGSDKSLHWLPSDESPERKCYRGKPFFKGLQELVTRPWFLRVWTLQEFVLAREVIFACGGCVVRGIEFEGICASFNDHTNKCCVKIEMDISVLTLNIQFHELLFLFRSHRQSMVDSAKSKLERSRMQHMINCLNASAMFDLREPLKAAEADYIDRTSRKAISVSNESSEIIAGDTTKLPDEEDVDFIAYMLTNGFRECFDPRDKVYGLMGLQIPRSQLLARPDYGISVAEVYANFAYAYICLHNNLHIFGLLISERGSIECPTWALDWRVQPGMMSALQVHRLQEREKFAVSKDTSPRIDRLSALSIKIEGIDFDTVDRFVGGSRPHDGVHFSTVLSDWLMALEPVHERGRPYVAGGQIRRAYFRLLLTGGSHRADVHDEPPRWFEEYIRLRGMMERSTPSDVQDMMTTLNRVWDHLATSLGEDRPPDSFTDGSDIDNLIDRGTAGRRLIMSQKGYLGLAPVDTQLGDKICILFGGSVPFILREQPHPQEIGGKNYTVHTIVGDCYVEGLMDGEGMEVLEKGEVTTESFVLV